MNASVETYHHCLKELPKVQLEAYECVPEDSSLLVMGISDSPSGLCLSMNVLCFFSLKGKRKCFANSSSSYGSPENMD